MLEPFSAEEEAFMRSLGWQESSMEDDGQGEPLMLSLASACACAGAGARMTALSDCKHVRLQAATGLPGLAFAALVYMQLGSLGSLGWL